MAEKILHGKAPSLLTKDISPPQPQRQLLQQQSNHQNILTTWQPSWFVLNRWMMKR
jgi:hypothetical protein